MISAFRPQQITNRLTGLKLNTTLLITLLAVLCVQTVQSASFDALFESRADNQQLEKLTDRLELGENAQGKFTQYRQLKVLKKPLISHGQFAFDSSLGLVWQQTRPFPSTLVLKDGELIQIDSSGNRQITKASESQGAGALAETMPKLLKALLSGEITALNDQFNLYLIHSKESTTSSSLQVNGWQLGLVPKDPLMLKVIPQMVLQGENQLRSLTLLSSNGDTSRIEFEQINSDPLDEEMKQLISPQSVMEQAKPLASQDGLPEPKPKQKP
ncbi:outer membrane lipoprotein carrier protein LolA [Shewanella woodyi]|uniref:Outer membrane lipoprotein carrier protein LolA n=1 Tax=Shewanella woodyi (strain ATCC 51908 / MS32) TaxID=392500 RepID=B1KLX4_SHEWM|nr:outer membrane lipoprotein carrier protein LolA [Shewanella woodyi]ACA88854.1 conserved hypothetical protein [Shewanella woodyi ATCC 51908]